MWNSTVSSDRPMHYRSSVNRLTDATMSDVKEAVGCSFRVLQKDFGIRVVSPCPQGLLTNVFDLL